MEDLRPDQHGGGGGQDWLNFEKWLKTSGWRKGERETHCNPTFGMACCNSAGKRRMENETPTETQQFGIPRLRAQCVVEGVPAEIQQLGLAIGKQRI